MGTEESVDNNTDTPYPAAAITTRNTGNSTINYNPFMTTTVSFAIVFIDCHTLHPFLLVDIHRHVPLSSINEVALHRADLQIRVYI